MVPSRRRSPLIPRQAWFWIAALLATVLMLYVFRTILLPFIAGMALAYFLDPVADRLQKLGLSRLAATAVILIGFIVLLTVSVMIVVPILASQLAGFIADLPENLKRLQSVIPLQRINWLTERFGIDVSTLEENVSGIFAEGAGFLGKLFQSVWASGRAILNVISLFVITPVVAFYMLLDWDRMVAKIDSWLPRDHVETIRQIAREMNSSVAGFLRGQGTVSVILGVFYATALTIAGLKFGLLIGLFTGLMGFIPYVGSVIGLVLSIGVALVQFMPDWIMVLVIAGIFFTGQFLEGNILQPKMVGDSVGLHPVWVMFALFAFGLLFGFTGLLIAVPAAAALAVVIRFALSRYLESDVYLGEEKIQSDRALKAMPQSTPPAPAGSREID